MIMRALTFVLTFAALLALSVAFLGAVDALPDPAKSDDVSNGTGPSENETPIMPQSPEAPVRVVAADVGMNATISNPTSIGAEGLDAALLHGGVRWPESALLGVNGTVLLFGHSSYLPVVRNQAFKAFNGIQKLQTGQVVSVYSATHEYRYAVTGVRLANATEDVVELPQSGKYLVLVTCDSFASKNDRFVVTATLQGVYAL